MTVSGTGQGAMQSEIDGSSAIDVLPVLPADFTMTAPAVPLRERAPVLSPAAHIRPVPAHAAAVEIFKGRPGEPIFRINRQPVTRQGRTRTGQEEYNSFSS